MKSFFAFMLGVNLEAALYHDDWRRCGDLIFACVSIIGILYARNKEKDKKLKIGS